MKYEDYDIEDFLKDEFFIRWVRFNDEDSNHFWERWILQHPEIKPKIYQAADLVRSVGYKNKVELPDQVYIETYENILLADEHRKDPSRKTGGSRWFGFFSFRNIAAVLLVSLVLWLSMDILLHDSGEDLPAAHNDIEMVSKKVPVGQKSIVTLSEGTKVYLNSNSELTYPQQFEDHQRVVTVKGEAFFEVAKEDRPFLVLSNDIKISVLGTSFNVRQMDEGKLSVALVSGKVRVNDESGNQVNLNPKEMLVIKDNGPFIKSEFDSLEMLGWKNRVLVFKKDSFQTVKTKLENWYGVQIEVKGWVNPGWTYSGIYEDEMLENVLRGIRHTSDISYTIKNKKVTISNVR